MLARDGALGVGVLVGLLVAVAIELVVADGTLVGVSVESGREVKVGVADGISVDDVVVGVAVAGAASCMVKLSAKLPPEERKYCAEIPVSDTVYLLNPKVVLSAFAK